MRQFKDKDKTGREIPADHGTGPTRIVYDAKLKAYVKRPSRKPPDTTPRRTYNSVSTPEMARKAAEGLAAGHSIARSLRDAGYSKSLQGTGHRGINRMIRAELKTLGRKYIDMGRDLTPQDQENIVRGRLLEDVIVGSDKGVMAAKQLGADKRVAMWQPESTANLVVLQAPPLRQVSHPVPLLPSKHQEDLDGDGE